jgi:hypothetical protein
MLEPLRLPEINRPVAAPEVIATSAAASESGSSEASRRKPVFIGGDRAKN